MEAPLIDGGQARTGSEHAELIADLAWTLVGIALAGGCIAAFWDGLGIGIATTSIALGSFLAGWHERGAESAGERHAAYRAGWADRGAAVRADLQQRIGAN